MLPVNAYRINLAPVVAEVKAGPGIARELEKLFDRTVVPGTTRSDSTRGSGQYSIKKSTAPLATAGYHKPEVIS